MGTRPADTETILNKCNVCGVESRVGSKYCYNCGGRIKVPAAKKIVDAPVSNGRSGFRLKEPTEPARRSSSTAARAPRNRPQNRTTEIRWERGHGPGMGLLLVAGLFAIIAAILILLALYLR